MRGIERVPSAPVDGSLVDRSRRAPYPSDLSLKCNPVLFEFLLRHWRDHRAASPSRNALYKPQIAPRPLAETKDMHQAASPVYGEHKVAIQYRVVDLLWRPAGRLVRFVAVIHPSRGSCLLMCTDVSLNAIEIIRLYGLRFKIEHSFKQAMRLIGSFTYHFWMHDMKPTRPRRHTALDLRGGRARLRTPARAAHHSLKRRRPFTTSSGVACRRGNRGPGGRGTR
jgi:hypothetical protein